METKRHSHQIARYGGIGIAEPQGNVISVRRQGGRKTNARTASEHLAPYSIFRACLNEKRGPVLEPSPVVRVCNTASECTCMTGCSAVSFRNQLYIASRSMSGLIRFARKYACKKTPDAYRVERCHSYSNTETHRLHHCAPHN